MRIPPTITAAALSTFALAGCASNGGETYQQEYERLNTSCMDRGGMLVPSSSPPSGRPALDYHCEIRDGGRLALDRAGHD